MTSAKISGIVMLAGTLLLGEQLARLSGPESGFVFDEHTRSIRVIVGVPGAAYLGRAVVSDLDAGSVSPDGRLAVVVIGTQVALLRLGSEKAAASALGEAPGAVSRIVWSDDSSVVALAGFAAFRVGGTGVADRLRAAPADALAVNRNGTLLTMDNAVAAAVHGTEFYVAVEKQVLRVRNFEESPEMSHVASVEDPAALAVSADGRTLWVADRASRSVLSIRTDTLAPMGAVAMDFEPARMEVVSGRLFRLDARTTGQGPVQLLDPARGMVFFVPTQDLSTAVLED